MKGKVVDARVIGCCAIDAANLAAGQMFDAEKL
jgi:fructose-1,6-bisphosphatase/inositol monophosphatase family enzyme